MPMIGIVPLVEISTGNADKGLGNGLLFSAGTGLQNRSETNRISTYSDYLYMR